MYVYVFIIDIHTYKMLAKQVADQLSKKMPYWILMKLLLIEHQIELN